MGHLHRLGAVCRRNDSHDRQGLGPLGPSHKEILSFHAPEVLNLKPARKLSVFHVTKRSLYG